MLCRLLAQPLINSWTFHMLSTEKSKQIIKKKKNLKYILHRRKSRFLCSSFFLRWWGIVIVAITAVWSEEPSCCSWETCNKIQQALYWKILQSNKMINDSLSLRAILWNANSWFLLNLKIWRFNFCWRRWATAIWALSHGEGFAVVLGKGKMHDRIYQNVPTVLAKKIIWLKCWRIM